MTSVSILFARADDRVEAQPAPAFFVDLNLDQIVDAVTRDWADYNLKPFFHAALSASMPSGIAMKYSRTSKIRRC
jgi:DNA mismatch repair protein MutS